MDRKFYIIAVILIIATLLTFAYKGFGQRPPRMDGGRPPEWALRVDINKNGRFEREEYRAAADAFFKKFDKNANGILEESELPGRPREQRPPPGEVPPFLFLERGDVNLTREQFDEKANLRFLAIDISGDRAIDFEELKNVRPPDREDPPPVKTAEFVAVEAMFGGKIVRGAPFSAETLREETRRLFDGSLVKRESRGALYRDGDGRLRQEHPFEFVGGFRLAQPDSEPRKLINIRDAVAGFSYALDDQARRFYRFPISQNPPVVPLSRTEEGKTESLGKRLIEGVMAEGTRTTLEIPAGQIGNDRAIAVVTEKWFSPELQMIVLSKHTDPFIGEVTFRLVNLKLGEPSPELFKVPADYQMFDGERNRQPTSEALRNGRKNQ